MENLWPQLEIVGLLGALAGPIAGDVPLPLVAARDVGEAAARRLLEAASPGLDVAYVLGPRDVTHDEVARVIGEAIGRPGLRYVRFGAAQSRVGLAQFGFSDDVARLVVELAEGFNAGRVTAGVVRSPGNASPTPIEAFGRKFADALAG